MIGVEIIGLVSDGGGSNVKFFNTLFGRQDKYSKWPLSDSVFTVVYTNHKRRIMYWYCSIHGLKALRNNLFKSQPNMARDLMLHGRKFDWKEVNNIYLRDKMYSQDRDMLDGFTMMNVTYAKSVFSEKTIRFQMSYLMKELNIDIEIGTSDKYASIWHQYNVTRQDIVSNSDPVKDYALIPEINLLEYQVAVYGVYIERNMNLRYKLANANIDMEERVIKNIMEFFYKCDS